VGLKPRAAMHLIFPVVEGGGGRGGFVPDADPTTGIGAASSFSTRKQNYDKAILELDGFFEQARRYKQAKEAKAPSLKPDLKLEAMIPVIDGKEPIMVTARREREIRDAITWADKQKVKIILVDAVEAMKVTKEIKDHNISVILGPSLALPGT